MTTTITLHVCGLDADGVRVAALADVGFGDALITQDRAGGRGGIELEFDTEPVTPALLHSWIVRAEEIDGVHVEGIGPSPIVNAADVAQRLGRTRQSVGQLASGIRGPGGWPASVNPGARASLWEWGAVARWANCHLDAQIPDTEIATAEALAWVNRLLRLADGEHPPTNDHERHRFFEELDGYVKLRVDPAA